MITGDNINTAISIAKNCRIIDTSLEEVGIYTYKNDTLFFTPVDDDGQDDSFELTVAVENMAD